MLLRHPPRSPGVTRRRGLSRARLRPVRPRMVPVLHAPARRTARQRRLRRQEPAQGAPRGLIPAMRLRCRIRVPAQGGRQMTITRAAISACALAALASTMSVTARMQAPAAFDEALLEPFSYRNLGPFRMGARTSDIAVPARAGERSPLHVLRRRSGPAACGRPRTTARRSSRSSTARRTGDRRRRRGAIERRTSSGSAPATRSPRAARMRATASTSRPMPARPGRTWVCAIRITSPASSIHPTESRTSSTSR